jgi:hypothetical protein
MISEKYKTRKVFGNNPWEIEIADGSTFEEMIKSPEMYIPHHVLEWKYSYKELNEMGRYKEVKSSELIWIRRSVHNGNRILHKDFFKFTTDETYISNLKARMKGNTNGSGNKGRVFSENTKSKLSDAQKKRPRQSRLRSEFGRRYFEHYGYGCLENTSQYNKEKYYYKINKHFSWEN